MPCHSLTLLTNLSQHTEIRDFLSGSFSLQWSETLSQATQTSLDVLHSPWTSSLLQRCFFRSCPCSLCSLSTWHGRLCLTSLEGPLSSKALQLIPRESHDFQSRQSTAERYFHLTTQSWRLFRIMGQCLPSRKCPPCGSWPHMFFPGMVLHFGQTKVVFMGFFCVEIIQTNSNL